MSKLYIDLHKTKLTLSYKRARETSDDRETIDITSLVPGKRQRLSLSPKRNDQKNRVHFLKKLNEQGDAIIVFADQTSFYCYRHLPNNSILIDVVSRMIKFSLTRRYFRGLMVIYAVDTYNILSGTKVRAKMYLDKESWFDVYIPVSKSLPSKLAMLLHGLRYFTFSVNRLIDVKDASINVPLQIHIDLGNGLMCRYDTTMPNKRIKNPIFYYAPMKSIRIKDKTLHIRRSKNAAVILMRRNLESVEKSLRFMLLESKVAGFLFYYIANLVRRISRKTVNVYYEKNAAKAEEGTFEVFLNAQSRNNSKNFFVINSGSSDYERIKQHEGVIPNHTLAAYWRIYRSNNVISTEAPTHVTILRSNNTYLRKSLYSKPFIFLQHGVTYMKCQGPNSAFLVGKEAEPAYMVVGSKKERDVVVDSLKLPEERVIISGLPIYDNVKYMNISADSDDIATIMLTWKAYEEHISDFSETSYYKNTIMLYKELAKRISAKNIRVVAHPKVEAALLRTKLAESLWKKPISEALNGTKLLITDYSSVCYNVFYQGGGVIFFQPDVKEYEEDNGPLIPYDDEYIGYRIFDQTNFSRKLNDVISDGSSILLGKLRLKKFVDNHQKINEFHDGKNVQRLCDKLDDLGII